MKRIIGLLLAVCMVMSASIVVSAATRGTCGDVNWKLNTTTGLLTIYGEGEMYFEDDEVPWYDYKDYIKKAVVEDGVECICSYAFSDCYNLTRVEIGADVYDVDIQVFDFCVSLSEICVDGDNEYYCSVDGNLFDKEKEIMMKYAPGKTDSEYRVPDGTVELWNDVFACMDSVERIEIPSSVEYLDSFAFECCWGLKEICVDEDNEYYCSVDGVLFDKDMMTLIQYPSEKSGTHYNVPEGVEYIDSIEWVTELKSVYIADSVTEIYEGAFWCCESLEKVRLPEGLEFIGGSAFRRCENLIEVYFEGSETEWEQIVIKGGNECLTDATIYFETTMPGSIKYSGTCGDNLTWTLTEDGLLTISGSGDMYDFDFNEGMYPTIPWYYLPKIKKAIIEEGVTSIGSYAFRNENEMEEIIVSDSVQSIGREAFLSSGIKSIIIPEGVKKIEPDTFEHCVDLKEITIPKSVESIGEWAFAFCDNLTDIYYGGTEADWNSIEIGDWNYFGDATIHYSGEAATPMIADIRLLSTGWVEVELEGCEAGGRVAAIMMDGNEAVLARSMVAAKEVEFDFSGVSGTTVKVFWWEDFGGMEPVCEAAEVSID